MKKLTIGTWVTATLGRFKGTQKIMKIKGNDTYLVGDRWCVENDLKRWKPDKGSLVVYCCDENQLHVGRYTGKEENGYTIEGSTYCVQEVQPVTFSLKEYL